MLLLRRIGARRTPDEVFHLNKRCPGKADVSIVMRVTMRVESIEPCG